MIGASPGKIGTALAQQNVRSALSFCNSPQMGAPEAYIQFTPGLITDDGDVTEKSTEQFLREVMEAFAVFPPPTDATPRYPSRIHWCEGEVDVTRRV